MKSSRIALVLAMSLCLAGVPACGSSSSGEEGTGGAVEKEEEVVLTEDDLDDADDAQEEVPLTTNETDTGDLSTTGAGTLRVGADGVGWVTVPDTWVEFHDTDGNTSIQYCDGTPYTVISLNTFDMSTVPEDERDSFTAEDAANSVGANMLSSGMDEESITGARVQLAGRDALQLYGVFPDGSFLVTWIVEDDEGVFHYVAAEGTEDTIMDSVGCVESSYSFEK